MKGTNERRIKALEEALEPDEFFAKLAEDLERFDTFERYLEFLLNGSFEREVAALIPNLKFQIRKSNGCKDYDLTPAHLRHAISHWYFVGNLTVGLNSDTTELIQHIEGRLESTEVIFQFKDMLRVSNPSVRWTDAIDLGKFSALLVKERRNIVSNLSRLRASCLACESLSSKYGQGHKLLHKALVVEIDKLYERNEECANLYGRLLREMLSSPVPPETAWPPDLCEIALDAIEQLATNQSEMIVRRLIDLAQAEMLIAFDENQKAREILEPYLEGVGDPEE